MPASVKPSASPVHLVRATQRLASVEGAALLEAFLQANQGEPRGFWGRGDAFEVWAGVSQEVVLDGDQPGRIPALRLALPTANVSDVGGLTFAAAPPRWFGGLSFLETPEGTQGWGGFPGARFILPRILLSVDASGAQITVQRSGEDGDPASQPDRMAFEVKALASALEAGARAHPGRILPTPDLVPGEASEERGAAAWTQAVEQILEAEGQGHLDKVVLARTRDVTFSSPVSVPVLLHFLRTENPRAHVFLFEPEPGRVLFGAAPEVLASLRGGRFYATAVAGSAPRGKTVHEDQLLRGGLLTSLKDRAEHRMTMEEMVAALEPRLLELDVPRGPGVLALARIQHLETPITGDVRPGEDILSLIEALHPTPAVCGRPRAEALAWIKEVEPFDRGWYAGPVGWLDTLGEGEFVPALRIGVGGGRSWRLYAGAGIVHGSDPHSEWEETALKFEPAHRALRAGAL